MTIDPDLISQLLTRVEADAHRRGWDEPAEIYVLYDASDRETDQAYRSLMSFRGPAIRRQHYAAQAAMPRAALDGHPVHALFRFSLNLRASEEHPAPAAVIGMLRQPGFLGVAFQSEGWMRTANSLEERDALGDVRFADIPGSVETRHVHAVDTEGNEYVAFRERGKKPRLERPGFGGMEHMGGAIIESLRAIVALVAGLPVPEIDNVPSQWDWSAERRRAQR